MTTNDYYTPDLDPRLVCIKPGLYVNVATHDVRWHGWLHDEDGTPLRRATVKQYAQALRVKDSHHETPP